MALFQKPPQGSFRRRQTRPPDSCKRRIARMNVSARTANAPRIPRSPRATGTAVNMTAAGRLAVGSSSAAMAAREKAARKLANTAMARRPVVRTTLGMSSGLCGVVKTTARAVTARAPKEATMGAYPWAPLRASYRPSGGPPRGLRAGFARAMSKVTAEPLSLGSAASEVDRTNSTVKKPSFIAESHTPGQDRLGLSQ